MKIKNELFSISNEFCITSNPDRLAELKKKFFIKLRDNCDISNPLVANAYKEWKTDIEVFIKDINEGNPTNIPLIRKAFAGCIALVDI